VTRLTRLLYQIFSCSECTIIILDPSKESSVLKCLVYEKKKQIVDKKIRVSNPLEKKIIKSLTITRRDGILAIPLISDDIIGLIILKRGKKDSSFNASDQEMLTTVAEQAVIGIQNLQLYDEQQKVVVGSVKSLITLMDTRVPQEYTHSPNFSKLVAAIGQEMSLDRKQIEGLKYASLLHDTGKIDIPTEILKKTSKLTTKEFNIVKLHPAKGVEILRPIQILKPAIPIIMYHHEKYDGTGYPSRLKKGQIPLGARIMAVADAFEAMVYGRPYRERMNIRSAIKEIKKKSGTQFDPQVVDAFLKAIKKTNTKNYLKPANKKIYNNIKKGDKT
ncbi:MAG: HD domain-containing protein, partial [Candidatus Omnitrophica bacterium]|nr:HD domain-containing protein [Candidatus Omnitrophota bacterium]